MENRTGLLFLMPGKQMTISLACMLSLFIGSAVAEEQTDSAAIIQPKIERQASKPARIDSENFELGIHTGLLSIEDFGSSSVMVARLAYHFSEDFFAEASYGMAKGGKTSAERLANFQLITNDDDRKLSYYNISFGFNLLPGEAYYGRDYSFHTALYLIGGSGSTQFAGDEHRTINVGFGYRLLFNDWLAGHLDVRDHIFDIDILGKNKTTHNIETTLGLSLFF